MPEVDCSGLDANIQLTRAQRLTRNKIDQHSQNVIFPFQKTATDLIDLHGKMDMIYANWLIE